MTAKKAQTGATVTPAKPKIAETPAKKVAETASAAKSTVAKKKAIAKGGISRAPRNLKLDEDCADYSHIYRNFYDIFVGSFTD